MKTLTHKLLLKSRLLSASSGLPQPLLPAGAGAVAITGARDPDGPKEGPARPATRII